MKILHCCLAAFYIDNFGYQENILPKMHKVQGHEVGILASTETYVDGRLGYISSGKYYNSDEISVTRIPYVRWLPKVIVRKLRIYNGVLKALNDFKPDIIFLHDCQFISIKEIAYYVSKNKGVRVYADGHTDFINSAKSWISYNILHKIIYKWCVNKIIPYTKKFYGTLPVRVDFFKNVYHTPSEKTELLLLGVDDTQVDFSQKESIKKRIRTELNLKANDFVVVTGGKLDLRKNIHLLMKVISELDTLDIKLIVFGSVNTELKNEIMALAQSPNIRYIGWLPAEKCYDYLFAADIAFFPGTHSVLWEQAVGVGLPCVFKRWEGIEHVDLGGNCLFIDSVDEIKDIVLQLYHYPDLIQNMRQVAIEKGIQAFSYFEIAKRAIEC
jgi:hypothetical protein